MSVTPLTGYGPTKHVLRNKNAIKRAKANSYFGKKETNFFTNNKRYRLTRHDIALKKCRASPLPLSISTRVGVVVPSKQPDNAINYV